MADPVVPPYKSGDQTSGYKLGKWLAIVGLALEPISVAIGILFPQSVVIAVVLGISGALVSMAGVLGYQITRNDFKKTVAFIDLHKAALDKGISLLPTAQVVTAVVAAPVAPAQVVTPMAVIANLKDAIEKKP